MERRLHEGSGIKYSIGGLAQRLVRFLRRLGPGLITGAADDDPSGISTYSAAGATTGFSMLWLTLISTPMMSGIQGMCARISMVTAQTFTFREGLNESPERAPKFYGVIVARIIIALMGAATVGMRFFMARGS